MKRTITTLSWIEPDVFKNNGNNGYLLARSGETYSIKTDPISHRSTAKQNNNYIEMNNYAEDYVWDQKYPDIPESYNYRNVATNTGLILIFYTDNNKLIVYDLLVDHVDATSDEYKVYTPTFPLDRVETRRYSIANGKFVMNTLFKDDYGYYGIIDSMKTENITNSYTNSEFNTAIGYLKHANMNTDVINQGYTFSTKRTFDHIILPSKKYFRTSGNVTVYGPNSDSTVCLNENGIKSTNTSGKFWYIKEPFHTSDGRGFVILKYAGTDSCILEVT